MKGRWLKNLWDSPTLMSWFNKVASSLRMLFLLPLILVYFNEVEVASWLLFSSIIFFSDILNEQASLIISRMIAAAYGGATDLKVITSDRKPETISEANWPLISHLYGSLGVFNFFLGLAGLVIALLIGLFSLQPLLHGYSEANFIWYSLFVFLTGQFLVHAFQRYTSMIRGCNKVALSSRWEALFSVLATIIGAIILIFDGGILPLAIAMQSVLVARIFCKYKLMKLFAISSDLNFNAWNFDRTLWPLVFTPFWKSLLRAFSVNGVSKVSIILLARNLEAAYLAKFLLSLRLLDLVDQFSIVPLSSHVPRFSKLLAGNKINELRKEFVSAFKLSVILEVFGLVFIIYFGAKILSLVTANTSLLEPDKLVILSGGFLLWSLTKRSFMITIIGNNIIAVKRLLVSMVLSFGILAWVIPNQPFWGFVLGAYFPMILILNIYPIKEGCALINMPVKDFIFKTIFGPLFLFILTISGLAFL